MVMKMSERAITAILLVKGVVITVCGFALVVVSGVAVGEGYAAFSALLVIALPLVLYGVLHILAVLLGRGKDTKEDGNGEG
jgi:hypothetical protein